MQEDVISQLARFTPSTPFDRDEMLFQAGRASAPSSRWWKRAVGLLSLALLGVTGAWSLDRPTPPSVAPTVPTQAPMVEPIESPSISPGPSSYVVLSRTGIEDLPISGREQIPPSSLPERPLRAGWRGLVD